jgi:uncharacterized protein (DUF58 family)
LTWRPAALIALGALALPLGLPIWPWLGGVVAAVAALVGLDYALAPDLPAVVRLRRSGASVVRLGEAGQVGLTITNRGSRRLVGLVRDAWPPSAGVVVDRHRLRLGPGESALVTTVLQPTRRGDRVADVVTVRAFGPLRLAFRQLNRSAAQRLSPHWVLRVLPRFESSRLIPEKLSRLRIVEGSIAVRGRGQGSEFDSLREYVSGDDVRSIDWRASARRSDVVVRTWRPERDRRVVCVLDTGRTSAVRVGDAPRLDAAMDAAQLLATVADKAGDRIDLLAIDTAVRADVSGATRHTLLARLADAMAPLNPALVETDFRLVVGEVLRRERKRALLVLFTALEPGMLAEGLLPVLPQLAARHKVIVAAVHDDTLPRLIGNRRTVEDLYLAAAAERTRTERSLVARTLSAYGVEVIDAPVERFASDVADAYLRLKGSGRL